MKDTQRDTWSAIIKVIIAVASALLGIIGGTQVGTFLMNN
jgi:hypothetical protein